MDDHTENLSEHSSSSSMSNRSVRQKNNSSDSSMSNRVVHSKNLVNEPLEGSIDASNAKLQDTLAKLGPMTSQSSSILALMEANPKDYKEVTEAIKTCPALTARVLAVINSSAFGFTREITSIDRTVALLGSSRARAIAMAYGMRILNENTGLPRKICDTIWHNSLQKAVVARKFCEILCPDTAEQAYSCVLIQDIGLPMLMAVDPDYYMTHINNFTEKVSWIEHERRRFGFDHAAVGQGLLNEWKASPVLQQAVLHHHRLPFKQLSDDTPMLDVAIYFASLWPHLYEDPTIDDFEWIQAIHTKFLSSHYTTPDLFHQDVLDDAFNIRPQSRMQISHEHLMRRLVAIVSSNTINLTAKLCKIEQDVDQTRQGMNDLRFQAFTDPLTKVLNRRGFTQLAERRLDVAVESGQGVCCMLADLDEFKQVNDTYGHDAGDLLLKGIARVMRRKIGRNNLIGRLGGDEFAILLHGVSKEQARKISDEIIAAIENRNLLIKPDLSIVSHMSLGVVYCQTDLDQLTIDTLLNMSDKVMYERKKSTKRGLVYKVYPDEFRDNDMNPARITRSTQR